MMYSQSVPLGALAATISGLACGGIPLQDAHLPSLEDISVTGRAGSGPERALVARDDTYRNAPEFWLGTVGVVRQVDGSCGTSIEEGDYEWFHDSVRLTPPQATASGATSAGSGGSISVEEWLSILGYPVGPRAPLEIRIRSVVTRELAAHAEVLSFFSADLSSETVAEIVLTDVASRRVPWTDQFYQALRAFQDRNPDVSNQGGVCSAFVVTGFTHKTLLRRYYTRTTAEGGAGYAGVRVNGQYFASSEDFRLDHLFGLSIMVFLRPTGAVEEPDEPTTDELRGMQRLFDAAAEFKGREQWQQELELRLYQR